MFDRRSRTAAHSRVPGAMGTAGATGSAEVLVRSGGKTTTRVRGEQNWDKQHARQPGHCKEAMQNAFVLNTCNNGNALNRDMCTILRLCRVLISARTFAHPRAHRAHPLARPLSQPLNRHACTALRRTPLPPFPQRPPRSHNLLSLPPRPPPTPTHPVSVVPHVVCGLFPPAGHRLPPRRSRLHSATPSPL